MKMTIKKHTPGPWVAIKKSGWFDVYTQMESGSIDLKIASTFNCQNSANARLIAAAPDMLGALTEAEIILNKIHEYGVTKACRVPFGNVAPTLDKARVAIAKAVGE